MTSCFFATHVHMGPDHWVAMYVRATPSPRWRLQWRPSEEPVENLAEDLVEDLVETLLMWLWVAKYSILMLPIEKFQAIWQCKWRHLMAKFLTDSSINLCKWRHLLAKFVTNKVTQVMVSTHGSVVLLAIIFMELNCCYDGHKKLMWIIPQHFHNNCG